MSVLVEPRLQLLAALLVKSFADPEGLVLSTGMDSGLVDEILRAEEARGLVALRGGALEGWTLTEEGRTEVARLVGDELDRPGVRAGVVDCYRRFTRLNPRLLGVCTRWQVRCRAGAATGPGEVVNDHTDAAYDEEVVRELAGLNEEVRPLLEELAALVGRFARYQPRLDRAVGEVRAGRADWFSSPRVDSYHSVWFELHEDLLATLGLRRSDESSDGGGEP